MGISRSLLQDFALFYFHNIQITLFTINTTFYVLLQLSTVIDIIAFHFFFYRLLKMGRYSGKKCRLITMFWLTTFFFLVEIIVGYITNSMALVADSFHMLSDVAALVVAYLSVKVSTFVIVVMII